MKRINADCGDSAFAGSGKFSDYRENGSWVMNQIEKGYDNVERGITVNKNGDKIRFSSKEMKIASDAAVCFSDEIKVKKSCSLILGRDVDKIRFFMNFSISGNHSNPTLDELRIMSEFIMSRICSDEKELSGGFGFSFESINCARIDFTEKCIYVDAIGCFPVTLNTSGEGICNYLKDNDWNVLDYEQESDNMEEPEEDDIEEIDEDDDFEKESDDENDDSDDELKEDKDVD